MQVQKLLKLLAQPTKLSPEDISQLESLIDIYPYFYLAHALLAKAIYTQEEDVKQYAVQKAATYAIDRKHLRKWLENKLDLTPIIKKQKDKPSKEITTTTNNYLEIIAKQCVKKSTNKKTIKQFSVIHNILNKNIQFDPFSEVVTLKEEAAIDLSEQATTIKDKFATETLAKIMIQQKKYKRAIEIYTHLMSKHPEKKSYIEDIIAKLNSSL